MIGPLYTSPAVQAVIGPYHSEVIPDVLYGAWLDVDYTILGTCGPFAHSLFGPATDGVTNIATVDGGLAGAGWSIEHFALIDSENAIIVTAFTGTVAPAENDPLVFAPGELTFTIAECPLPS